LLLFFLLENPWIVFLDYYFLVESFIGICSYVRGFQSYFLRSLGDGFVEDGMARSYNLQSQNRRESLEAEDRKNLFEGSDLVFMSIFGKCLFSYATKVWNTFRGHRTYLLVEYFREIS